MYSNSDENWKLSRSLSNVYWASTQYYYTHHTRYFTDAELVEYKLLGMSVIEKLFRLPRIIKELEAKHIWHTIKESDRSSDLAYARNLLKDIQDGLFPINGTKRKYTSELQDVYSRGSNICSRKLSTAPRTIIRSVTIKSRIKEIASCKTSSTSTSNYESLNTLVPHWR